MTSFTPPTGIVTRRLRRAASSITRALIVPVVAGGVLTVAAGTAHAAASYGPYSVIGTGSNGLNERAAPSTSGALEGNLANGTTVYIACQASGSPYSTGGSPATDSIWDELTTGKYVADYWVSTPAVGTFSAPIPQCSPPPPPPPPPPPTTSRSVQICHTQELALFGANVYEVCLTADDSFTGSKVTGKVTDAYCNIYLPTGLGNACGNYTKGSYWNSSTGQWEDWLNFRINFINPDREADFTDHEDCVYLRVDTSPNGQTSYQNFANTDLDLGTKC